MPDLLVLLVFAGLFCGALALAGMVAEYFQEEL